MITICKNCRAALDETVEKCPDCGFPNPWFDERLRSASPNGRFGLSGVLSALFRDNAHVQRTLLLLGAVHWWFFLISLLRLTVTPWSQNPVSTRLGDVGFLF